METTEELDFSSVQNLIDTVNSASATLTAPKTSNSPETVASTDPFDQIATFFVNGLFDNDSTGLDPFDAPCSPQLYPDRESITSSPPTVSLHLALAAKAYQKPQDLIEYYHLQMETPNSLVEVNGCFTLDSSLAISLVLKQFAPTIEDSLKNPNTWIASAMEPPTSERPLNTLANFRPIGRIPELGDIPDGLNQKFVVALSPSALHFIVLLIDSTLSPLPAPSGTSDHVSTPASLPTTSESSSQPSITLPHLSISSPSSSSSQSLPSSSRKTRSSFSKPSKKPKPLLPTKTSRKSKRSIATPHTPAPDLSGRPQVMNIDDVCRIIHGESYEKTNERTDDLIDLIREWRYTYDVLIWLGYDHSKGLKRQHYTWSSGSQDSFHDIIARMKWTDRDFKKKCSLYLWASQVSSTHKWDPENVPPLDPNPKHKSAHRTWQRIVYLFSHPKFLPEGVKPNPQSAEPDEVDLLYLRQEDMDYFSDDIEDFLVPLSD
ncbi:hypothetical protein C8R42DRAFT_719440 [Lentinula raphanica]|nr:hypothetical protein C8R42DRAFT_719440 [Lentinula raphanica]